MEKKVINHPVIAELNPSSLNTLRIVTVKNKGSVHVLYAGLRVGGDNSKIDNISQGGMVAKIDIETGTICSDYYTKKSAHPAQNTKPSPLGIIIPMWEEVLKCARDCAMVVDDISYVAWDIAVTPDDVELIEGNESFGSVIMQLFGDSNEIGLKPRLDKILRG